MNVLVTGSTGLLGQALSSHLAPSCEVTGLSRGAPGGPGEGRHVTCDLRDAQRTIQVIRSVRPTIVMHTQALSDVDHCEREPSLAQALNILTTRHVVQALQGTEALLVHLSTAYVFDGHKGAPYDEVDEPRPMNVYGASKLTSEQEALRLPRAIVVRTSLLFGAGRMNFCDQVVAGVRDGQPVEAFVDQRISPTYTMDLAEALRELALALQRCPSSSWPSRIFHVVNAGGCSRVEFAQRIVELLGGAPQAIQPIRMADQHRSAARPACAMLTTQYVPRVIGRTLRSWDDALQAYLRQRRWLN